jgi:pimeloyl-ACP methyl ester carboxylesterase
LVLFYGVLPLALFALGATLADPGAAVAQPAASEEEIEIPKPEDQSLITDDGVALVATFYPSYFGKDAVPIILLHGYKGNRRDFDELALYLQELGHAVIAPDLRGHGDSKRQTRRGTTVNLDASRLRKEDFLAMAGKGGDIEAVKRFLMGRNNAAELNIEKLCVVGAEMGATLALAWAVTDWNWAPLSTGKQGQDVKALVLISPEASFKGIPISVPLKFPPIQRELSMMLVAGTGDSSATRDATKIHNVLEKYHPAPPAEEAKEKQDLFFFKPATSLSGTRMLGEKSLGLNEKIASFIQLRLVSKAFPWSERKNPVGN